MMIYMWFMCDIIWDKILWMINDEIYGLCVILYGIKIPVEISSRIWWALRPL